MRSKPTTRSAASDRARTDHPRRLGDHAQASRRCTWQFSPQILSGKRARSQTQPWRAYLHCLPGHRRMRSRRAPWERLGLWGGTGSHFSEISILSSSGGLKGGWGGSSPLWVRRGRALEWVVNVRGGSCPQASPGPGGHHRAPEADPPVRAVAATNELPRPCSPECGTWGLSTGRGPRRRETANLPNSHCFKMGNTSPILN